MQPLKIPCLKEHTRRSQFGGYAGALWGIASYVRIIGFQSSITLLTQLIRIIGPLVGGVCDDLMNGRQATHISIPLGIDRSRLVEMVSIVSELVSDFRR